jgi:hypothetical protein
LDANWTQNFWFSRAELGVKKPFLVRRAAGKKSGDGLVCLRLDLVTVALRGRQAPHRLLPTPADNGLNLTMD